MRSYYVSGALYGFDNLMYSYYFPFPFQDHILVSDGVRI